MIGILLFLGREIIQLPISSMGCMQRLCRRHRRRQKEDHEQAHTIGTQDPPLTKTSAIFDDQWSRYFNNNVDDSHTTTTIN